MTAVSPKNFSGQAVKTPAGFAVDQPAFDVLNAVRGLTVF